MPTGKHYGEKLRRAVTAGEIDEAVLDDKVRRILRVMFQAGLFDESVDDYGGHADTAERRNLALQVARASIVLLKNKDRFLPLQKDHLKSIAVIGPNGDVARMCGGGSGALRGHYGIAPLQGIREAVGPDIEVRYERGIRAEPTELPIARADLFRLSDGKPGIQAEYFANRDLAGEPVLVRVEQSVDFDWGYGADHPEGGAGSPQPGTVPLDKWSARWSGKFMAPGSGSYDIGLKADNGVRLYLDGKRIIDSWTDARPDRFKTTDFSFEAGREYDLCIEYYENIGSCRCQLGLARRHPSSMLADAVACAAQADVVILCLGLNDTMEGEASDREDLALPPEQLALIRAVTQANARSVVVLNNGTPLLMDPWIGDVPAVLEAFYPGQEGGRALADILFGNVSPSGRLPLTFPKRWEDSPVFATYPGPRDAAHYNEGIFVGYRHFDKAGIEPLFPFGHGLSYTAFDYSDLCVQPQQIPQNGSVSVDMAVANRGRMAGAEVVQLYVRDVSASVEREQKALKGFARVQLAVGEKKRITFKLDKRDLSFYDPVRRGWVAEPGTYEVWLGSSSRDIRLQGHFHLQSQ